MRDANLINKELGSNALPYGIVSIPVNNNIVPEYKDDVELDSCASALNIDNERFGADSTYVRYGYLIPALRHPMQVNFNMTDEEAANMSFMTLYGQADAVQSQMFENIKQVYPFTQEDLNNINMTQVATLVEPLP